jgi:diguanylate cyclase (GGDEF)-like protein
MNTYLIITIVKAQNKNTATLKQLSIRDDLTGLYNRRFIIAYLEQMKETTRINPALVGIIDIDDFKKINDTYGHIKGDETIRHIGHHLQNCIGNKGIVGRYGGDEFIVILDDYSRVSTRLLLNKLCQITAYQCIPTDIPQVTISGGFTPFYGYENIHDIFELADKQLYLAKKKGRNQMLVQSFLI